MLNLKVGVRKVHSRALIDEILPCFVTQDVFVVPLLSWYTAEFDDKDDRVQGRNDPGVFGDPLDLLREIAVISEVENT